jgi:putative phage-type endonuclease
MDVDIIEAIHGLKDSVELSIIEWREYLIDLLSNVYKKASYHPYCIDQIVCAEIPKLNNGRYQLRINRTIISNDRIQLEKLLLAPKNKAQKSQQWLSFRHDHINASETHQAFTKSRNRLMLGKVISFNDQNHNTSANAMDHGNLYERIAVRIQELKTGKKIYDDFESIEHEKYSFLAASPDGIDEDGCLVEIKCPWTREILGMPKPEYWVQTQMQMEVCQLSACKFVECQFKEYECSDFYREDVDEKYKGVILYYIDTSGKKNYRYSSIGIHAMELDEWLYTTRLEIQELLVSTKSGLICDDTGIDPYYIGEIYWKCNQYSCFTVLRDTEWFRESLPILTEFWNEVETHRASNTLPVVKTRPMSSTSSFPSNKLVVDQPIPVECIIHMNFDDY